MPALELILEGDGAFADLATQPERIITKDAALTITALSGGTVGGRPSVMLRLDLPDGRVVLAETTMRLFLMAADALRARYGVELG